VKVSQRYLWIDYAKVIGIFLVVFGHTAIPRYLYDAIYGFHMPLFFFISGYLFSFKKFQSLSEFFYRRAKQLIVPYFCFNIITYIFWLFIGRHFGVDSTRHIPLYKPIIGIFYGNGIDDYLVHDITSWFLVCLFTVENLFFVFFRRANKYRGCILLMLFALTAYLDGKYDSIRWPWGLNIAFTAIVFYGLGNIFKEEINALLQYKLVYLIIGSLLILPLCSYVISINAGVDLNVIKYNNYLYFFVGAGFAICIMIVISRILEYYWGRVNLIEYISRNTIVILIFQFIAMSVVKGFAFFILKLPANFFDNKVFINLLFSVIVILMLMPLMFILESYFPFLIGKPSVASTRYKDGVFSKQ